MMQQQVALMAATQSSYLLNPMAAVAAAQMQQMAAFNVNGLVATPMTPPSGRSHRQPLDTHSPHPSDGGRNWTLVWFYTLATFSGFFYSL